MMKRGGRILKRFFERFFFIITVIFVIVFFHLPLPAEIDPQYKEGLERLSERLRSEGFSREEVQQVFADSRLELYPQIVEKRGKGFNYMSRKFGLLTKSSLDRGMKVLSDYRDVLEEVEQAFGVEKEVLVAILRVETNFGRNTGSYPVLNSLITMSVIENRRSAWAEKELIQFLRICREQNKDPFLIKGSWAGAFGICQFIPTSYSQYAVDGNGDGIIDLFDFRDAIASIANYLKAHGWQNGKPAAKRKAVYAYNHCDSYVQAVLAYAKATKKKATS